MDLGSVRGAAPYAAPLAARNTRRGGKKRGSAVRGDAALPEDKEPGSERAHHSCVRPAAFRCVRRQSPASEQLFGHAPTSAACSAFKSTAPAGSARHSVFEAQHSHVAPQKRSSSAAGQDRLGAQRVCGCCAACLCSVLFSIHAFIVTHKCPWSTHAAQPSASHHHSLSSASAAGRTRPGLRSLQHLSTS